MIELRVLGPPELTGVDAESARMILRQPRRLALLVRLVLEARRGFERRDRLLGAFWPEHNQERARHALRQALHVLRNALGHSVFVKRGDDEVSVNPDVIWCDAVEFSRLIDAGRLEDALALYRGDLLPGFFLDRAPEFERWLEETRADLRARAAAAASRLAADTSRAEDDAVAWARRAHELSPDDEGLFRRLLVMMDRAGDRAGALSTYAQFARRLAHEYDVEPAPETQHLVREIGSRHAASTADAARAASARPAAIPPSAPGGQGGGAPDPLTADEYYSRGFRASLRFSEDAAHEAEQHYRAAIAIDPAHARAYAGLGALQMPKFIRTGDRRVLEEGIAVLERAIALDPASAQPLATLSYMLTRQHRFSDAAAAARRAIELEPEHFDAWYMLGTAAAMSALLLHRPAELPRAILPYLRTVALRAEHFSGYVLLATIYLLRGEYAHASIPLDAALQRELGNPANRFVGALPMQAVMQTVRGDHEAARHTLDDAIRRYTGHEHAYAPAMLAYAYCTRGCVAERTGDFDAARDDFIRAAETASANDHVSSIGTHWARGKFGIARALHRRGRAADARRTFAEADSIFQSRSRFVWSVFVGASDAHVLYERAATLAAMGNEQDALDALRRASRACWADEPWLRGDPSFASLLDSPELRAILDEARAAVTLPPPTGDGGLPGY